MSIDWFTFAAQIINFLILVALLRWFLYEPIVGAMKQREEKLAAKSDLATRMQREGEERVRQYEQKVQAVEEQRETLLSAARREAEQHRQQLIAEARGEVQSKRLEWFQTLERERAELLSELRGRAGHLTAEAARRTLAQLAGQSLEERVFTTFNARLRELGDERREEIRSFLGGDEGDVIVRTAFEVPDEWRESLRATVLEEFGYEGIIDFQAAPDLICGIELEAGGYGFGWNVGEFLRNMEAEFDERLKKVTGSGEYVTG